MNVGILTTHDSTNYGAILQAYALSQVLQGLGNNVYVIDRRRSPQGEFLKRYLNEPARKRIRRYFSFAGGWIDSFRRFRTKRFIQKSIQLTPYHFHDWRNAPTNLGLDAIVIGSDQVWNPKLNNPLDYLPGRIPTQVPCISYAASIGLELKPTDVADDFKQGLSLLKAISLREQSSVTLVNSLGFSAAHVIDPVALAGKECWQRLLKKISPKANSIFVYSLGICDTKPLCEQMSRFAVGHNKTVEVFTGGLEFLPLPSFKHPKAFLGNLRHWITLKSLSHVTPHLLGGPKQFLRCLAASDTVITNSFHGMVFASVFGKNTRFILPTSKIQKAVISRINDYADRFIEGPVLQPSLPAALESIASGERTVIKDSLLNKECQSSLSWLQEALRLCETRG